MKANELARRLSGIELGDIGRDIESEARKGNLVVVYGDGRDLVKFIGAIDGTSDVPEGGAIYLDADGLLPDANDVPEAERAAYYDRKRLSYLIDAEWETNGYKWSFQTIIPHRRFVVMNEGARYCRGIVFDKSALGAGV